MLRFIDTHNHVGVAPISWDLNLLAEKLSQSGIRCGVITAGGVDDFEAAADTARKLGWGYCVGLHPMYIRDQYQDDLLALRSFVQSHLHDPYLVGIGEIGLDFYVPGLDRDRQLSVLHEELQLAADAALTVSVHSRRALYKVMEVLSFYPGLKVVLHAFAGSLEEVRQAEKRGYFLGVGGAVTYEGSKRVRAVAKEAAPDSLVLETDAPDMAPAFAAAQGSDPTFLPRYLDVIAQLRSQTPENLAEVIFENSLRAFPKLLGVIEGRKNFVANP